MNLRITVILAALVALIATSTITEASTRQSPRIERVKSKNQVRDITPLYAAAVTQDFAAKKLKRRISRYGGKCDGFQKCRCGVTAARRHNLPLDYNGMNLKMASTYYQFPRTTCHAGAVAIPHAHHVMTIEQCNSDGTALVSDEKGTYTRSIRGATLVEVSGGGFGFNIYSAKERKGSRQKLAANTQAVYPQNMSNVY